VRGRSPHSQQPQFVAAQSKTTEQLQCDLVSQRGLCIAQGVDDVGRVGSAFGISHLRRLHLLERVLLQPPFVDASTHDRLSEIGNGG
jgi:hypothetical protein